jgi:hypothetical protein
MIRPASVHLIKKTESWLLEINPRDEITAKNFSTQARGAYLRPHNAFLSLQTVKIIKIKHKKEARILNDLFIMSA